MFSLESLTPEQCFCYHCGQARSPNDTDIVNTVIETPHWFCCHGCKTIHQTILAGGWSDFYQFYNRPGKSPKANIDELIEVIDFDWQSVITYEGERCSVQLHAPEIHCAACVWLIERALAQQNLTGVAVNLAQQSIVLQWKKNQLAEPEVALKNSLHNLRAVGYAATPLRYNSVSEADAKARRSLLLRMTIALFASMQVMMVVWPSYFKWEIDSSSAAMLRFASFLMSIPVVFYSAGPLFKGAWLSLKARYISMDVTVVFGILSAFLASMWNQFFDAGPTYYDSITMFVALLLTARYIERAVQKTATNNIDTLARTLPQSAQFAPDYPNTASLRTIPSFAIRADMVLCVRAGEIFAIDGAVVSGQSLVEEAILNGESLPVPKTIGSPIYAGSKNIAEVLWVRAKTNTQNSRVAQIVNQVQNAIAYQAPALRIVDQIARYYLLMVCVIAVGAAVVWLSLGQGFQYSLQIMIAALVVSCPCALSMAVPAARAVAIARLSKKGLLTLRGNTLDALARITDIVFDKTGTLTEGQFNLVSETILGQNDAALCARYVHALEAHTSHPLGLALVQALPQDLDAPAIILHNHRNLIAAGVMAEIKDGNGTRAVRLGTFEFVAQVWSDETRSRLNAQNEQYFIESAQHLGHSTIFLADQNGLLARYVFSDQARPYVTEFLRERTPYRYHLLSGDRKNTVAWWGQKWGIAAHGGLNPQDKAEFVRALQAQGHCVLAIGDGVNDAPLLAQADASIALASGTPLAQGAAAMIGTTNDVRMITTAISISKKMRRITYQNLAWALMYNGIALPLAAFGYVTPLNAGIGMSLSSLFVVFNAARLR